MIDNSLNVPHGTRICTSNLSFATRLPSTLDTTYVYVSSGIGAHLTLTKKRQCMRGKLMNYLQQDWCADYIGDKIYKTAYI